MAPHSGFERDPLAGSRWSAPDTIGGFVQSPPNAVLLAFAEQIRANTERPRCLDLGCGPGRNAIPLAQHGWDVLGIDLSWPMLRTASERMHELRLDDRLHLALAPMDCIPVRERRFDLIIAHGIWNLARTGDEHRRAVAEAARVARPGAALFVFTFSRHTIPPSASPVAGEAFVFTQFSGQPQCFLTDEQLVAELGRAGFKPDPTLPLREHNRPTSRRLPGGGGPVIYEGGFRYG